MAGRWNDEWDWRAERDWRDDERYETYEAESGGRARWPRSEGRSFEGDRVFGERDSGVGYNRGRDERPDWQRADYRGVSPAMRRGDYETGYRARSGQDARRYDTHTNAYGANDWRNEQPGPYGYAPEGRRFGTADADRRWSREMRRPVYGDARTAYGAPDSFDSARSYRDSDDGRDFEDRAREAGDFFRRAGRRISNWFSDATDFDDDRERYEAYRGHRGVGPKGYQRSDDRIGDEVNQRLTDDAWLDASEVSCSVSGGEVTLSGTVRSREAKHRAERLVEDVSGVKHVQNNLRIDPGSYFTRSGRGFDYSADEAGMASSETLKDVTDGHNGPPAQKKN
ncbi:BON domain-containing protein [Phenylobacterium sp.]|uniref:BON domain-containing protein n=1 Tax=Phenylobacterium sp. TaxID=1871053 RepID=UPI00301BAED9